MLIPQVWLNVSVDKKYINDENTTDFQWLEEEEIEDITELTENIFEKLGGSPGGFTITSKQFKPIQTHVYKVLNINCIKYKTVLILKKPRYIHFCCLKLHC